MFLGRTLSILLLAVLHSKKCIEWEASGELGEIAAPSMGQFPIRGKAIAGPIKSRPVKLGVSTLRAATSAEEALTTLDFIIDFTPRPYVAIPSQHWALVIVPLTGDSLSQAFLVSGGTQCPVIVNHQGNTSEIFAIHTQPLVTVNSQVPVLRASTSSRIDTPKSLHPLNSSLL